MRIDRRSLMRSGIACAVLAGQGGGGAAAWVQGSASVVHTRHGPVRGRTHSGVHVFKGVAYGADTSGAGRFRMPTDPEPWREVREAATEGPQCPQRDPDEPLTVLALPESEDCLTLNVWTPGPGDGRKRPVMVWLHGGGLWAGSAAGRFEDWPRIPGQPDRPDPRSIAGPWQEGSTLALRQDVVIVSPNHRINILGQLYLEEWDQDFQGSANVGMFDIVHALKWVRDNIERFGGDPGNVTIFGQSGGGQKVSILMAMPAAQGLFHKAICMSGPAPAVVGKPYAREMSRRLLERLDLTTEQVRRLQHVPVADVMRAMRAVTAEVGRNDVWGLIEGFAPVAGSYGLPGHPFWGDAPAASVDVPLLIGSTMTEMSFLVQPFPELARMDWGVAAERVQRLLGAHASAMMAVFRAAHPAESAWQIYSRILSHWPTRAFTLRIADNKAAQRCAPVFLYRVDWLSPVMDGAVMAPHAIDVPFVFDTVDTDKGLNGGGPAAQEMARRMSTAWANFARTGHPAAPGLPDWPAYSPADPRTMTLSDHPAIVVDPDSAERVAIQAYMKGYSPMTMDADRQTEGTRK